MTKTAKIIILLLVMILNVNVLAQTDTIRFDVAPTKNQLETNFISADQSFPDIKYISKYVAIPHNAEFSVNVKTGEKRITENVYIKPALKIASDLDNIDYQLLEDTNIYSKDEYFPTDLVKYERMSVGNVDLILIGVATEQYNPVKKQLRSFGKSEVTVTIETTSGKNAMNIGENLSDILKGIVVNPEFFDAGKYLSALSDINGCNYLIITPDNAEIRVWADTLRKFREEQGIITKVLNIKEIGTKPDSLRAYLKRANETWIPAPEAVLLLGDYHKTDVTKGITTYALKDHPEGHEYEPYLTDNQLVDFDKNSIPDMVIARMPAANGEEAQLMVEKTLQYERHPSTNPDYYKNPVTAMGFQQNRWFQLCTEIISGYWEMHGKQCTHINAIYEGTPDSTWSTAENTDRVLNAFGPDGLNYIPATMQHLTQWNGSSDDLTEAIENGSFMVVHRDHGTFETWGEPYYSTSYIENLNNDDLSFVFSANCQTGDFGYGDEQHDCFAERFLRTENGAVAVIAASQLSFSFVNDTYVWGVFDYLYPDFMPNYGSQSFDFQYPAFANAYGKLFLKKSSFPYNVGKVDITNRLFHYFGDAYLQLNTEMPEEITISHPDTIQAEQTQLTILAEDGAHIALSVDGQLIAKGKSVDGQVILNFAQQKASKKIKVVATKQNRYRHESFIKVAGTQYDENVFEIWPVPCDNELTICGNRIHNIKIINTLGIVVKEFQNLDTDEIKINTAVISSGVYMICVNGVYTCKIVVR